MRLAHPARLGLIVTLAALLALLSGTTTLIGQGSFTATGDLITARTGHTATLLDNEHVLVTGGSPGGAAQLASTEIYAPPSGPSAPGRPCP